LMIISEELSVSLLCCKANAFECFFKINHSAGSIFIKYEY
jgi:hypothetical protein